VQNNLQKQENQIDNNIYNSNMFEADFCTTGLSNDHLQNKEKSIRMNVAGGGASDG
jgi:hypothetical protein